MRQAFRLPYKGRTDPVRIAGLTLWLKYDYGTFTDTARTTPAGLGEVVKGWTDIGGGGYHATEATNGPVLAAGGLTFDGVNDVLRVPRMTGQFGNGFTYFLVNSLVDARGADHQYFFGAEQSGVGAYFLNRSLTTGGYWGDIYANVNVFPVFTTFADGPTGTFIGACRAEPGVSATPYFNGTAQTPVSLATVTWSQIANANTEIVAVGGEYGNGAVARFTACTFSELIIYNRPLTTAQILAINRYLGTKYGVTVP